jgi:outer membrane protein assembly factor BamB
VATDGKVLALDAAGGGTVREYPEAGKPSELLHVDGTLLAIDGQSVRALDVDSAALVWKYQTSGPRYVVADDRSVLFLEGDLRRGEKLAAVCLDRPTGSQRWRKDDYPWLDGVRRMVCHGDLVAFEVSTLADTKEGNALHVVSAVDGRPLWDRSFVPGMNHMKQARAMFIGDTLWVLEDRQCVALDPRTGEAKQQCPAGFCHCFPPVATPRFMLAGEMELTDLASGRIDANRITKAACSRDYGWVPANGLIYVSPKHCVCWPMLRGYTAMAPASAEGDPAKKPDDWPCYRHDAWRSSTTAAEVPAELAVLWTTPLGGWPEGIVAADWREDPFVHGPVTPPVIAGGTVYVARPDAQQVVALDARSGEVRWRFTANGRVDTAPTIYGGLCLFGAKTGWVYAVRADDGRLVWRLRAAPSEEQIVAYGQLESPWPVPGSVLVVDGVAYFAAGRQPLAEGGILVFAVEPASGKIRWVKRLDTVPTENFYGSSGLEFDNFDLLQEEGKCVAMSRWLFDRATGEMTCKGRDVFAVLTPGEGSVVVPRGCWTYAPRHQPRHGGDHSLVRPLAVFSNRTLLGSLEDFRTLYRRDFHLDGGEKFDMTWITGWAASENFNKKEGPVWRCDRLAEGAAWKVPVFAGAGPNQRIAALVLAGETLFAAGSEGELVAVSSRDGKTLARLSDVPSPVWDGMAAAEGRLFVTAQDGRLLCLGRRTGLP